MYKLETKTSNFPLVITTLWQLQQSLIPSVQPNNHTHYGVTLMAS